MAGELAHVVLFDIVAYSRLSLTAQGEAESALRKAVEESATFNSELSSGGLVVVDTGDGIGIAYFGDPLHPALTALEVLDEWRQPVRLKASLHSGPVIRVTDIAGKPNVKGLGINVASRVMDCAEPNGIFMTEHYAGTLRKCNEFRGRVIPRGTYCVKHGVHLRICELDHPRRTAEVVTNVAQRATNVREVAPNWLRRLAWGILFLGAFLLLLPLTLRLDEHDSSLNELKARAELLELRYRRALGPPPPPGANNDYPRFYR